MGKRLIILGADYSSVSVDDPTISAPTFSPSPGQFQNSVSVTIASRVSGATIHYTTNGSTPTTSSTVYTSPIVLNTLGSTTIKAIAVKNGVSSAVASATYQVVDQVIEPTGVTISGVPSGATSSRTVQLSAAVTPSGAAQNVNWQVIDGDATVSSSGLVTYDDTYASSGIVTVRATVSGHSSIYAEADISFAVAPSAPVITPSHGNISSGAVTVTITAAQGAEIYYTLDGSTPTANSTRYTSAITISTATTLKAIAVRNGLTSDVATGTYAASIWRDKSDPGGLGFYNYSLGTFQSNVGYTCTKSPIQVSGNTNLGVHVKAGWQVRIFFSTSGSDNPSTTQTHTENIVANSDIVINANENNPNGYNYMWINLSLKGTTANNPTEFTDEQMAAIHNGEICYWDEIN